MSRAACLLCIGVMVACGPASRPVQDDDGTQIQNHARASIAADAGSSIVPASSRDFVSGAGRLSSRTFTMDVEIGEPIGRQRAVGGAYSLEGNAAITP